MRTLFLPYITEQYTVQICYCGTYANRYAKIYVCVYVYTHAYISMSWPGYSEKVTFKSLYLLSKCMSESVRVVSLSG